MITPRRTRLVRVRDLHGYRRAIASLVDQSATPPLVVVPTQAAARVLTASWDRPAVAHAVTRDQLYGRLHQLLPGASEWLSAFERDALMQAAAAEAAATVPDLPFRVRPGLVAEILRFYDQLRRQTQSVRRFEELLAEALGAGSDLADRGAERLLRQTRFLVQAFGGYERRVAATGRCDEHTLRARLLVQPTSPPVRHVVVTVPDWIADPAGLFVADFELLAGLPGLEQIDLVGTTGSLGSGFHERIHQWWPGLEEIEGDTITGALAPVRPYLAVPRAETDSLWIAHRDRHEELAAVARRFAPTPPSRAAIVFKHPLPYLYLAPEVFEPAGLRYRAFDALPLAAEPAVVPLDLILETLESDFARTALIALLASPYLRIPEARLEPVSLAALNRMLSDLRYLGGAERLTGLASAFESGESASAYRAATTLAHAMADLTVPAAASAKLRQLAALLRGYFSIDAEPPLTDREQRARGTIDEIIEALATAHAAHYDPTWTIEELATTVRRWIGDRLSAPPDNGEGVALLDDQAARYGEFEDMTIVGLIDAEWPERPRRNIFYTPALLKSLGWPSERDRRAADDARFLDLIASATTRVELSTFTLDDETLVSRSVQLDEVPRAKLSTQTIETPPATGTGAIDAGVAEAAVPTPGDASTSAGSLRDASPWAAIRAQQAPPSAPEFHGSIGAWSAKSWSVSSLETYLACPFKFFAQHVLRLEEEPDDEEVMDPRRQGQFVHEVFETFFRRWQDAGHRTITAASLPAARQMFELVAEERLQNLPEGERALERSRLLGTSAASGLGEAVFRMEAEREEPVIERLLEHSLSGRYVMATAAGPRPVQLRGKADRIDLLADGTFRVIDYKLGWPPDRNKALQLPIYSLCAEQQLAGRHQRNWTTGEAVYLAFKGPKRVVPLFTSAEQRTETLERAQQRLADTIDAIERGEFPPSPDDVFRCDSCSFSAVCRKDYVGPV